MMVSTCMGDGVAQGACGSRQPSPSPFTLTLALHPPPSPFTLTLTGDGYVDLYIGNTVSGDLGETFHGAHDDLLRNNGDGTFTPVRNAFVGRASSVVDTSSK